MNLSNFEQYIDVRILERGREYWESGRVSNMHWDDECIVATVRGGDLYQVEIDLEGAQIDSVFCDCPYDWDEYCKHVVAVLFALKHDGMPESDRETLDDIIQAMSPEEMRSLLGEILSKEPEWRERIMARCATEPDDIFSRYSALLKEQIYSFSDRGGFIGYHQAHDVGCLGDDILAEVETLIIDEEFDQAFAISKAVILTLNEAIEQADDSNGYIGGAVQNALGCLRRIAGASNVSGDIKDDLFEFLTDVNLLEQFTDFDWHYDLMEIAVELADTESREQRLFSVARRLTGFDDDISRYAYAWYQQLRLSYLTKFASFSEAESFIDENIDVPEIRSMKLEKLYKDGQYDEVIRIARLGVAQDSELPGLVRRWQAWVLKGAEGKKDSDLQKEVLKQLYFDSYDLKYYKKLKSLFTTSDWLDIRQEILQAFDGHWRSRAELLIEEQMSDELWRLVSENKSLDVLEAYDTYLVPEYTEEIRDHYLHLIPEFLNLAKGRTHYQRIAGLLSHRANILGTEFCGNVVSQLLQLYPNRPAMRDEFRQAGLVK
ncbi:SWIM zinc finger family protein [Marispirochaeta sp.]|uniref:SWIM zinc finger family protein n=1 Tax=Marispirochaeta sp. TaxID=2038653 RepID=UPI0029C65347|nr:SWIM zinc finger family protein [Marispirochaeta sp.]